MYANRVTFDFIKHEPARKAAVDLFVSARLREEFIDSITASHYSGYVIYKITLSNGISFTISDDGNTIWSSPIGPDKEKYDYIGVDRLLADYADTIELVKDCAPNKASSLEEAVGILRAIGFRHFIEESGVVFGADGDGNLLALGIVKNNDYPTLKLCNNYFLVVLEF